MPIKAVIFDLGGVLVRTEDQAPRRALAERLGISLGQDVLPGLRQPECPAGLTR